MGSHDTPKSATRSDRTTRRRSMGVVGLMVGVVALLATWGSPAGAATAPNLGTAESFAVLAATTVTNTGPSVISGNVGVSPGLAVTGFPPGVVVNGTIYRGGEVPANARADARTAYNNLASQPCPPENNLTGQDLGGMTLTPGVYCFESSAQLTGTLTLDAQGDPNAVFIFQIGSTLTTASGSSVNLINGADPCNVFWQVGSSATLGTTTQFVGTIIANTSITANNGADVQGRLLALTGAVTLDTNDVTRPVCAPGETTTTTTAPGETTTTTAPGETTTTTVGAGPGAGPDTRFPAAAGGRRTLPRTGSAVHTMTVIGVLAIVLGSLALLVADSRQPAPAGSPEPPRPLTGSPPTTVGLWSCPWPTWPIGTKRSTWPRR